MQSAEEQPAKEKHLAAEQDAKEWAALADKRQVDTAVKKFILYK